jgi:glycosyltransferase involved in cell wall biosynthesis
MDRDSFFVVVPFYNEAAGMEATLAALAAQSDPDFALVLVDNGSTDASREVACAFCARHPELRATVIVELEKGTGAASDTGFRFAIARGARFIARTDADCLPRHDWVANLKRAFGEQDLEFVIGRIRPRTDDFRLTLSDRLMIPFLVFVSETYGKLRHNGPQFRYRYILAAGNNLAITASMYLESGGFPRSRIEDVHEDRILADRVRMRTTRTRKVNDAVVYNSIRRLRHYGYIRTLLWYWEHKYRPQVVDIR